MPRAKTGPGMGALLADLTKRHGVEIGALSTVVQPVRALTTGNLAVDYVTGVGGLPLSRITELYGPFSSGKTTTALQTAAVLQRTIIDEGLDEHILYFDFEKAIDRDYCAALGLDTDHDSFLLAQPAYLEQAGAVATELIATGKIRLMVVDSVAAMAPRALVEGDDFDRRTTAMERARLLSSWLLRLAGQLAEHHAAAVFINHLMETIDMSGARAGYLPPKEDTPGGKGLKFYASLRLRYQQTKPNKGSGADALTKDDDAALVVGSQTQVRVTKNKVGPPFRQCEVRVVFGRGFDNAWSALQVCLANKVIRKDGSWLSVAPKDGEHLRHPDIPVSASGQQQFHGEGALLAFAEQHPDWRATLIDTAAVLVQHHSAAGIETGDLSRHELDD